MVLLLVVTVLQRSIGFGRGVLFCRWLPPAELGQWEMAYSFLLLAAPLAVLGIPGSFGRYLEQYRARGQLRTFLRRTTCSTAILGLAAVVAIVSAGPQFSRLVFGTADQARLIVLVALSLAAVILHHFLEAIFVGLRMFRVVSVMQFSQSVTFAVAGIGLLWGWRLDVAAIVLAYGAACLISAGGALLWSSGVWRELPTTQNQEAPSCFWPKLLRFAFWVWMVNLFANLFAVIDRYMILHFGMMDTQTALAAVGHYHSSRIVPLLLVSVADLLAGIVLPHLSHAWEAGRRHEVSRTLNFTLKLAALAMLGGSALVLWASPVLFDWAFAGRYEGGRALLPMTLAYCTWYGLFVIAQNYLWCAEKTRLAALPLAAAVVANVLLNLMLLPRFGVVGAVLGTTLANAACLAGTLLLCRREGMRIDFTTLLLLAAPATLCMSAPAALALTATIGLAILGGEAFLTSEEKHSLFELLRAQYRRWGKKHVPSESQ